MRNSLQFYQGDVLNFEKIAKYDVVFLAALVGKTSKEKVALTRHIAERMKPGALLILRSANRLKKLLYPPIEMSDLAGLQILTEIHPHNEVVNSLMIARKQEDNEIPK